MSDLETAYKRDLRDQWRASGGTTRRPLQSFLTAAEKRERREEHAARINCCREWLETADGIREFLRSRELNRHLSDLNQALAAFQAPGQILGTVAYWKREGCSILRGQHGAAFLTAPGFWPKPAFMACQTSAGPEYLAPVVGIPSRDTVDELRAVYVAAIESDGRKPALARLLESIPGDIAFAEDLTPSRSDEIPF